MRPPAAVLRAVLALALLALAGGCAVRPVAAPPAAPTPAAPVAVPPSAPAATPTPSPTPTPAPIPPVVPEREDVRPPVVRVLLQTAPEPLFQDPGRRYACLGGGAVAVIRGPLVVKASPGRAEIQVGAFAKQENLQAALARLAAAGFEGRSESVGGGPQRVVAVAREGEDAAALSRRLAAAGFSERKPLTAVSGGGVSLRGEGGAAFDAPTVRLVPLELEPVRLGARSFRGEFELRPAGSGAAVVDVVNLEEYLRGVVPAEMGPRAFPSLEALKAQAVAARTYAVAHLGDHSSEGYDLCDSPACQAYEGAGAEQPLTDRAVQETAGEIATYRGRPIDAMYHSTCAGHTEDAAALFPDRAEPYLLGVPCRGEASVSLGGRAAPGPWLGPLDRLAAIGESLARSLGVRPAARALAGRLTGRAVEPGVAALVKAFALESAAPELRVRPAAGDDALEELLRTFRLPLPPPHRGAPTGVWELALAVRLAQLGGQVQTVSGRLVPGPAGPRLVADGGEQARDLDAREAVLVKRGERWRRGAVTASAGSPATLWCAGGVCPVVEVDPMEAADAGSAWTWWVREFTLDDIGRRLGFAAVREIRVLRRGVSGRALTLAVVTASGVREVAGIPFRRALDLPDTLFFPMSSGGGAHPSIRFLGRGWGHGVGMCQNGAYGLARGGETYVQILQTYYTGVQVGRWEGWKP